MKLKTSEIKSIYNSVVDNRINVSWKMTNWCNYRCPYCVQLKYVNAASFVPEDTLIARAKRLNDLISAIGHEDKIIKLSLVGGEVTCYDLYAILSQLDLTKIDMISITTNFFRDNKYFIDLATKLSIPIDLTISYHERQPFGEFYAKALDLKQRSNIGLRIAIVVDNNTDVDLLSQVIDGNLKILPQVMRLQNKELVQLDEKHQAFVDKYTRASSNNAVIVTLTNGEQISYANRRALHNDIEYPFKPQGMMCSCGRSSIRILVDGTVVRGSCQADRDKVLGSLDISGSFTIPNEDTVCTLPENDVCNICNDVNIYRK